MHLAKLTILFIVHDIIQLDSFEMEMKFPLWGLVCSIVQMRRPRKLIRVFPRDTGTYEMDGQEAYDSVKHALEVSQILSGSLCILDALTRNRQAIVTS